MVKISINGIEIDVGDLTTTEATELSSEGVKPKTFFFSFETLDKELFDKLLNQLNNPIVLNSSDGQYGVFDFGSGNTYREQDSNYSFYGKINFKLREKYEETDPAYSLVESMQKVADYTFNRHKRFSFLELYFSYKNYARRILPVLDGYSKIIKEYSDKKFEELTSDKVCPVTQNYFDGGGGAICRKNSLLAKNAREFYDVAVSSSDQTKAIFYYYSSLFYLSFLIDSLLRFPSKKKHHGMKFIERDGKFKVELMQSGFFQRLLDMLTCYELPSFFGKYLVVTKDKQKQILRNSSYLTNNSFTLDELIKLDCAANAQKVKQELSDAGYYINKEDYEKTSDFLRNQIILFYASNLSRYAPEELNKLIGGLESGQFNDIKYSYESMLDFIEFIDIKTLKKFERAQQFIKN